MKQTICKTLKKYASLLYGILTAIAVSAVTWSESANSQQLSTLLAVIAFAALYRVLPLSEDRRVCRAARLLSVLFAGAVCLGAYETLGLVRETRQNTTEMFRLAFVAPITFFGFYLLFVRLVGRVLDWLSGAEAREDAALLEQRTKRGER